jgi:hypothetical protein
MNERQHRDVHINCQHLKGPMHAENRSNLCAAEGLSYLDKTSVYQELVSALHITLCFT